ncbi:MAG: hypothetical protein K2O88_04960 [Paramuribaculum sp.]|nr:hypothetical protein [Paramuribaculum sp.]
MSRRFIVILLMVLCFGVDLWSRRTTRRSLKAPETSIAVSGMIPVGVGMISVGKYDKPLRSRYETVFVTNHTDSTVTALRLRLQYISQGDTIHQTERILRCNLPARSTRRLTFSSWDKQFTLYYHLTDKPSRLHGTPYDVCITPVEISVSADQ